MSFFPWGPSGPREDAIAAATLGSIIGQQIPALANYSLSARRDAALAEVMVSFAEQLTETGVFTGVNPPNPLTIYSLTSTSLNIDGTTMATATVAGGLTLNPSVTPLGSAMAAESLTALFRTANTSANHKAVLGYTEITAATTHTLTGATGYALAAHAAGTVSELIGTEGQAELTGAGTVTTAVGGSFFVRHTGAGTITNAYGARLNNAGGSGTIGTQYGLYVEALTRGATNYAIYTNAGPVRFGDTVTVVGTLTAPGLERTIFLDSNKSSTSVGEASITSYVMPASTLATNGQSLQIWVSGYCSAAVNFGIKFGSTYVAPLTNYVSGVFRVQVMLSRTGAATQEATFSSSDGGGWVATAHTSPTETLSGPVTIDFRGNKDTSANITLGTVVVALITGP